MVTRVLPQENELYIYILYVLSKGGRKIKFFESPYLWPASPLTPFFWDKKRK